MKDGEKTKKQLLDELAELRQNFARLHEEIAEGKFQERAVKKRKGRLEPELKALSSIDREVEEETSFDFAAVQELMDYFYKVTNIGVAILDLKGNILVSTGWQDICAKFHRIHPGALKNCIESDLFLSRNVERGKYILYKCKNNLREMVTPIIAGNRRIANLYLGQFFFDDEAPDYNIFIAQAKRYGFDEGEYLAALERLPRWSRESVQSVMEFYSRFAGLLSRLSYSNIKLVRFLSRQKRTEQALRESENRYGQLLDSVTDYVYTVQIQDGRPVATVHGPGCAAVTGYTSEDYQADPYLWYRIVYEHDRNAVTEQAARILGGEAVSPLEHRIIHRDGSIRWVRNTPVPHYDGRGQLIAYDGLIANVTERKRMDEALRESELRYRNILHTANEGFWLIDNDTVTIDLNTEMCTILGRNREEILGRKIFDFVDNDNRVIFEQQVELREQGKVGSYEIALSRPDGSHVFCRFNVAPLFEGSGNKVGAFAMITDITERKLAEEALKESQQQLARIINFLPYATFVVDMEGKVIAWNRAIEQMTGVKAADILGKGNYEYALPFCGERRPILIDLALQPQPEIEQRYAAFERTAMGIAGETCITAPGGSRVYLYGRASALYDSKGNVVGAIEAIRDITERRRIEEALRDSELAYRTILHTTNEGFWLIDNDTVTIDVNPRMCAILGRNREEILGRKIFDFVDNENRIIFEQQIELRAQGQPSAYEIALSRPDGSHVFCQFNATPLFDESGTKAGSFGMVTDITDRVHKERQIELLNRLYCVLSHVSQAVVRAESPDAFLREVCRIIVEEGDFLLCWIGRLETAANAVLPVASWGKARQYVNGVTVCADDRPEGRDPTGTCIRERRTVVHNDFLHDPNTPPSQERTASFGIAAAGAFPIESGGRVWGALTIYSDEVGFFGEEDVVLLQEVAKDIGFALDNMERERLRRQAEETLRVSEDRYRRLFEDAVLGIFRSTMDGKFIDANPAFARIYGFDSPEQVKSEIKDIAVDLYVDPSRRNEILRMILESQGPIHTEVLNKRKDGSTFTGSLHVWMVRGGGGDGTQSYLEGFIEDITERKHAEQEKERLEAQLRQAQKLEAIGTLAGGIAHDFNNILAPIMGYSEMAINDLPDSNPMKAGQEQILNAALRARNLVKQILTFSRPGRDQNQEPVAVSSIVKEALKLLRASLPSSIEIRHGIEDAVANADPTQIHQVLMNLCTNAAHAMDDKGVLEVRLSRVYLSENDLTDRSILDLKPGRHVKLSVSDTGSGMDKATLERIFDPYFTTKEVGKGTGLGLAVVHGIVKLHGGAISVQSKVGKGTTFSIFIPAMEDGAMVAGEARPVLPTGTERILLIDDEQRIVEMGTAILERLGYKVTPETDSLRTLEMLRSRPRDFDLIITDYTMPNLSGMDLVREVRRIRPDIPIILCTGFSEKVTWETAMNLNVELVLKPFTIMEIAELIRKVLDVEKN